MTIREAIDRADRLRPNTHEMRDKLNWLTGMERLIAEFMNRHENVNVTPPVYDEGTDDGQKLLLDHEDAELYVVYLMMKYDFYNGEYDAYNNQAMHYKDELDAWKAAYRREHMPRQLEGGMNLV